MENQSNIQGKENIVIQGVTDSTITLNINGETQEILNKLDALQSLLEKQQAQTFQSAGKIYNIGTVNHANFGYLVGQAAVDKSLPGELAENLITDDNLWVNSLRQELLRHGISVGNKPWAIFQHYGWLIEVFLQKMGTPIGQERTLQRLSFMAEAYQSSLRYLCYIQLAQIMQMEEKPNNPLITDFINLETHQFNRFDFLNLLLVTTDILNDQEMFMPDITDLVSDLTDAKEDLYRTVLFLDNKRNELLAETISEETLENLLDEYLTALVFWLRNISFLAKYRLVSIKDISLNYRVGTPKNFVHLFGELHGVYSEAYSTGEDYNAFAIEGEFTYNQSVLLFKGSNVEASLNNIRDASSYLSLSPLIIDQSVFAEKSTQTPEIYYYTGQGDRRFTFAQYKNELTLGTHLHLSSNKSLEVKRQNTRQPKLDELFDQLENVFKPFKTSGK